MALPEIAAKQQVQPPGPADAAAAGELNDESTWTRYTCGDHTLYFDRETEVRSLVAPAEGVSREGILDEAQSWKAFELARTHDARVLSPPEPTEAGRLHEQILTPQSADGSAGGRGGWADPRMAEDGRRFHGSLQPQPATAPIPVATALPRQQSSAAATTTIITSVASSTAVVSTGSGSSLLAGGESGEEKPCIVLMSSFDGRKLSLSSVAGTFQVSLPTAAELCMCCACCCSKSSSYYKCVRTLSLGTPTLVQLQIGTGAANHVMPQVSRMPRLHTEE